MSRLHEGTPFFKMTGSGNDFVMFDVRVAGSDALATPAVVRTLCAPRTGIGADGVVILEPSTKADFRMRYYNSDGSRAALCGNATLCSTRLAVELGIAKADGMRIESDSGLIAARMRGTAPEIDFSPVTTVLATVPIAAEPGEQRLGFAEAGVPHLVVLCDDVDSVDVEVRGRALRRSPQFAQGTNVDFVSKGRTGWRIRTFERGVEGETLACGTGAVGTAVVLATWGLAALPESVTLITRSGLPLVVRLVRDVSGWRPSLQGEARLIFRGTLANPAWEAV